MVVPWLLDGVARGSEGADVLVVVVRWCCGGRWVVRVRTRVMCVSKIFWGGCSVSPRRKVVRDGMEVRREAFRWYDSMTKFG